MSFKLGPPLFSEEEADKLKNDQWPSLKAVWEYGTKENLSHLLPVFPFASTNDNRIIKPGEWGIVSITDHLSSLVSEKKKLYRPANKWNRLTGDIAFHIVPYVTTSIEKIIPASFIPSVQEVKDKYPDLTKEEINYEVIRDGQWDVASESAQSFFYELMNLVEVPISTGPPTAKKLKGDECDKDKSKMSVTHMWLSFVHCLKWINNIKDPLSIFMKPERDTSFMIGEHLCTAKFDSVFTKKQVALLFVFQDSELKSSNDPLGQKQCKSLAFAISNLSSSLHLPQEVFGIGIQHTKFQFFHAVFPHEYMTKVRLEKPFAVHEFITLKLFNGDGSPEGIVEESDRAVPHGLDITDPAHRVQILQLLEGIGAYLKSNKALIGTYTFS
eukprot:Phypoly_transcript_09931.p1 GENE.Phypoly_transcript_09931~~Phypoly_transcript_09931.p1  ORF type:complete len:384 (+),score=41.14 Phypoly_transcript_09931:137-1288(+)